MEVHFGSVRVHSLTLFALSGACEVTHGPPSWPSTLQAFALVGSSRLGLQQMTKQCGICFFKELLDHTKFSVCLTYHQTLKNNTTFLHYFIASKLQFFVFFHLVHPMVQKMLKLMKKWASYAHWKWSWFAKVEHNNLVCVFEFKLFVCYSITSNIPTKFVILLLVHPMVQKIIDPLKVKRVICKN